MEIFTGCHFAAFKFCSMCIDYQFKEIGSIWPVIYKQIVGRGEALLNVLLAPKKDPPNFSPLTPLGGISQGGGGDREGCSVL